MRYHTSRSFHGHTIGKTAALVAACMVFMVLLGCPRQPAQQEKPTTGFALVEEAGAHYETLLQTSTEQEAREDILAWLLTQPGVEDAGITSCGATVWIYLDDGTSAAILTESFVDADILKHTAVDPMPASPRDAHAKLQVATYFMAPFRFQFPEVDSVDITLPPDYYREPFTNIQLGVELRNEEVTVDFVRGFFGLSGNYIPTQLFYTSHGGTTRVRGFPGKMGMIATGEVVTPQRYAKHLSELQAGRLVTVYLGSVKKTYFCFTPEFVRHWVASFNSGPPEGQEHWLQRYLYIGACNSGHQSWRDVFAETGAVYYAAYDGPISKQFHIETASTFFEHLAAGTPIFEAHMNTEPKTDPDGGGSFVVDCASVDAHLFYRGFIWVDGEPLSTVTHTWLSLGYGNQTAGGLTVVDVTGNFVGSIGIRLDSLATGTHEIAPDSDAAIEFIKYSVPWRANSTLLQDHNAPCGGHIEVIELEDRIGTPVRFTIDAVLVYTEDFVHWEEKTIQGEFTVMNLVGLEDEPWDFWELP